MLTALRRWLAALVARVAGPGPGETRERESAGEVLVRYVARLVGLVIVAVLAAPIYVLIGMPGQAALSFEARSFLGWTSLVGFICWALLTIVFLVWLIGRAIEWAGYRFARGVGRAAREHKPGDSK